MVFKFTAGQGKIFNEKYSQTTVTNENAIIKLTKKKNKFTFTYIRDNVTLYGFQIEYANH